MCVLAGFSWPTVEAAPPPVGVKTARFRISRGARWLFATDFRTTLRISNEIAASRGLTRCNIETLSRSPDSPYRRSSVSVDADRRQPDGEIEHGALTRLACTACCVASEATGHPPRVKCPELTEWSGRPGSRSTSITSTRPVERATSLAPEHGIDTPIPQQPRLVRSGDVFGR